MNLRSTIAVAMAVVMTLAIAGCGGAEARALEDDDSGSKVEMQVGDELTVRLPSNVTTGFSWVLVDDAGLASVAEPLYEEPKDGAAVGAGGAHVFRFSAERVGTGNLVLEYRRPWEKDVPAEKTWSATINVR